MTQPADSKEATLSLYKGYIRWLRRAVTAWALVSGLCVTAMILITCADVVLRLFGRPIVGAYDIVRIAGAICIAGALPYTTAVKGHVAIEYFFHHLTDRWRLIVDSVMRGLSIVFFAFLTWECLCYGLSLKVNGQVSATLELPLFWVPYVIAGSCATVCVVILGHLVFPSKEIIKP